MSLNVFLKRLSDLGVVVVWFFFLWIFYEDEVGMKMRKKIKEGDEDGKNKRKLIFVDRRDLFDKRRTN